MTVTPFTPGLGPIAPRLVFATLAEARHALCAVIARAERRITLAAPCLEPDLYAHPMVLQALTRFVLSPRYTRVRILLAAPAPREPGAHALMGLSRRLSTSFDIRVLAPQGRPLQSTYLVADASATLLRLDAGEWEGMYALEHPAAARSHLIHFESLWQRCPPSEEAALAL